jgi:2-polyprenyl-3-methyl-5-hydroxy-6-metoxy-1,4-benzoquinol methylase
MKPHQVKQLRTNESDASEFWQDIENDKIKEYSHWQDYFLKGPKNWGFRGRRVLDIYNNMLRNARMAQRHGGTMVDWGIGGGMTAIWFGNHYKKLYGVDICQETLDECGRQLANHKVKAEFEPVRIDLLRPEKTLEIIEPGSVDFFLSTSCFQHFPHAGYARRILAICNMMLSRTSLALIQIRWWDGSKYYAPKMKDYCVKKNAIRFLSFEPMEFHEICLASGFFVISKICTPRINYAFYLLRKTTDLARVGDDNEYF